MTGRNKIITFALLMFLLATAGCAPGKNNPGPPAGTALLLVTWDYGAEVIVEKYVEVSDGQTIFEIMVRELDVDTAYGGLFINGINGLESGYTGMRGSERKMADWFFFINGVASDTGPHDQLARPGQVIWWDYHEWDGSGLIGAVTGAFPQPFVQGYTDEPLPVTVYFTSGQEEAAEDVKATLEEEGVADIGLLPLSDDVATRRQGPSVVVGLWSEVSEFPSFVELNERKERSGLYAYYNDEGLSLLRQDGSVAEKVTGGAGSIIATGAGLGDSKVMWMILGTDGEGLARAVAALASGKDVLPGNYGVWAGPAGVFTLPVKE